MSLITVTLPLLGMALNNRGTPITVVGGDPCATDDGDASYVLLPDIGDVEASGEFSYSVAEGSFTPSTIPTTAAITGVTIETSASRLGGDTLTFFDVGAYVPPTVFDKLNAGFYALADWPVNPTYELRPQSMNAVFAGVTDWQVNGISIAALNAGAVIGGLAPDDSGPPAATCRVTYMALLVTYDDFDIPPVEPPPVDRIPLRGRQRDSGVSGPIPMRGRNNAPYGLRGRQESNR